MFQILSLDWIQSKWWWVGTGARLGCKRLSLQRRNEDIANHWSGSSCSPKKSSLL